MGAFGESLWQQISASNVIANIIIAIIVWPIGLAFWWVIERLLSWLSSRWRFLTPKQKQWFKTHRGISQFFYNLQKEAKRKKKF